MIKYRCPHCSTVLRIDEKHAGRRGHCNHCDNSITIPSLRIQPGAGMKAGAPRRERRARRKSKVKRYASLGFVSLVAVGLGIAVAILRGSDTGPKTDGLAISPQRSQSSTGSGSPLVGSVGRPKILTEAAAIAPQRQGRLSGPNFILNPGFEGRDSGWQIVGPSLRIEEQDAYSGNVSLRITWPRGRSEVDAISDHFSVRGSTRYHLSARVRWTGGSRAGFKVTVAWSDAQGRHLGYSNDWRGFERNKEWDVHEADLHSPSSAAFAAIILGVGEGGDLLFDDLDFRLIAPGFAIAALGPSTPLCEAGRGVTIRCRIRNTGSGPVSALRARFECGDWSEAVEVATLYADSELEISIRLPGSVLGSPGNYPLRATITAGNAATQVAETQLFAIRPAPVAALELVSGANAKLRFVETGSGFGVVEVVHVDGGREKVIGRVRGLATLQYDDQSSGEYLVAPLEKAGEAVVGTLREPAYDIAWHFEAAADGWFRLACELTARRDMRVHSFTFPEFHYGYGEDPSQKDSAIFCGLEYLTEKEMSSGTENVVAALADRYVPHPNKITVPLMAVCRDGVAAGLAWDPLQPWVRGRSGPAAIFASPNRLQMTRTHLMALSAPGVGRQRAENALTATKPYLLKRGETIALASELFVLDAPRNVAEVLRDWYSTHDLPDLPPGAADFDTHWQTSIQARLLTWEDAVKGWRPEFTSTRAYFASQNALQLLNYGLHQETAVGAQALKQARDAVEKLISEGVAGGLSLQLALHVGQVDRNLGDGATGNWTGRLWRGVERTRGQQPDGSWTFQPDQRTESLGRRGDTAVGICADPTLALFQLAKRTGHAPALRAALKGLDYIDTHFARPAGGETWEIPLHAPNLRASAMATECAVIAYELTGEEKYLDSARYWATTGLPFIYTWEPSDRPGMRFASVSVFGATFYEGPWFGKPVQWVGLDYSRALHDLSKHDDTFPWQHIAKGIVLSCVKQQQLALDPQFGNPWPGAIPDAYEVVNGAVLGAWIGPERFLMSIQQMIGIPSSDIALVGTPGSQIRILSAARIESTELEGDARDSAILKATLAYPPGNTCYSLLTCIVRPKSLRIDGADLPEVADLDAAVRGWRFDPQRKLLGIKHPFEGERILLEIDGARYAPTRR